MYYDQLYKKHGVRYDVPVWFTATGVVLLYHILLSIASTAGRFTCLEIGRGAAWLHCVFTVSSMFQTFYCIKLCIAPVCSILPTTMASHIIYPNIPLKRYLCLESLPAFTEWNQENLEETNRDYCSSALALYVWRQQCRPLSHTLAPLDILWSCSLIFLHPWRGVPWPTYY